MPKIASVSAMIELLVAYGWTENRIGRAIGVSGTSVRNWRKGGTCRMYEPLVALRRIYNDVCKEMGVKHD